MGAFDRLFGENNKKKDEVSEEESSRGLTVTRHVVFGVNSTVIEMYREKETDATDLDIVAVAMGKVAGSVDDVIINKKGSIYPSEKLKLKLCSWSIWLDKSGGLFVTEPVQGEKESDILHGAIYLGSIPYLQYMAAVCLKLGLDSGNISVSKLSELDAYIFPLPSKGAMRFCAGCGRSIFGETPKLTSLSKSNEVSIKTLCSQNCAKPFVQSFIDRKICVWCGRKASAQSWKLGGFGEPYCCDDCWSAAGRAMFWFEFQQGNI